MKNFFKTVAIVTVFSVSEKFLGFIYRIFLSHKIGAEGVGIYSASLSLFGFLFTLVSSGIPITVSRLITKYKAENNKLKVQKVITAGLTLSLAISLPVTLLIFAFRGGLFSIFADDRCVKVFLIILPGIIFTSVYSLLRGVFWGNKDFMPYSIIELLEEICMILVGVFLINNAISVYDGAVKAGIAVIVSYVFSFTLSLAIFIFRKNKLKNPFSEFKPLLTSSAPVTIMRTVGSLTNSLVAIILPMGLIASGLNEAGAMSLYGSAMGQALPILFIPSSLINSFILVLIPEISESFYKKHNKTLKNDIEKSINFTTFLTSLFAPMFLVCGKELGVIIFNSIDCGNFLSASSILVIFMGLSGITTSILNSLGAENKVLFFHMISGVFMLLCVWLLPRYMGIYALLIGFLFIYGLTSILNLILIYKKSPLKPKVFPFLIFSILITLPSSLIGVMAEKMLLPLLGSFFSVMIVSLLMMAFSTALFFGFNLLDINIIKNTLPIKKRKNLKTFD